jgi:hypothetical protein
MNYIGFDPGVKDTTSVALFEHIGDRFRMVAGATNQAAVAADDCGLTFAKLNAALRALNKWRSQSPRPLSRKQRLKKIRRERRGRFGYVVAPIEL